MKQYKVKREFYKLSNKTNYVVGDMIELNDEEAEEKAHYGLIEHETFGISTKKTIEEVDKEIKKANKKAPKND
jgi:hypothetical protein